MDRYVPATVNGMLSALRGILKAAWELGYMTAEDCQRAASVKTVKGETLPAGRNLKQGEILALANVCIADKSPAGVRDAVETGDVVYLRLASGVSDWSRSGLLRS
jgi:hypothetical protein